MIFNRTFIRNEGSNKMADKPVKPVKGNERFELVYDQRGSMALSGVHIWVDRETGVNYMFTTTGSRGGLTPLLDATGNPIVTPVE